MKKLTDNRVPLIKQFLEKDLCLGNKGEVFATAKKPIIMRYTISKGMLELEAPYPMVNSFGNTISMYV